MRLRELWNFSIGESDSLKSRKKESSTRLLLSYDFFKSGELDPPLSSFIKLRWCLGSSLSWEGNGIIGRRPQRPITGTYSLLSLPLPWESSLCESMLSITSRLWFSTMHVTSLPIILWPFGLRRYVRYLLGLKPSVGFTFNCDDFVVYCLRRKLALGMLAPSSWGLEPSPARMPNPYLCSSLTVKKASSVEIYESNS